MSLALLPGARVDRQHPEFRRRLDAFSEHPRIRGKVAVRRGDATLEEQTRLWEKFLAGDGNPASNPNRNYGMTFLGYNRIGSWHQEQGPRRLTFAVDLTIVGSVTWATVHSTAYQFGLRFPIATERWHMQGCDAVGWYPAPKLGPVAPPIPPPPAVPAPLPIPPSKTGDPDVQFVERGGTGAAVLATGETWYTVTQDEVAFNSAMNPYNPHPVPVVRIDPALFDKIHLAKQKSGDYVSL